jgi:poly-gamma-glutamate synthesis protein (capsule biosynthesis protein)
MASAGVPAEWAATDDRPGVAFLPELPGARALDMVARRVWRVRRPGDIVVASIHWGSNWGYSVPRDQTRLAHALIDRGVDVVHGHSSHHPRPIEVYHGKLILYGCGDLINDYEGISGYHEYRDDLRLLYLASLRAPTGELAGLRMSPMQARRMRLRHASPADARWLRDTLQRASRGYGVDIDVTPDGTLALCWP